MLWTRFYLDAFPHSKQKQFKIEEMEVDASLLHITVLIPMHSISWVLKGSIEWELSSCVRYELRSNFSNNFNSSQVFLSLSSFIVHLQKSPETRKNDWLIGSIHFLISNCCLGCIFISWFDFWQNCRRWQIEVFSYYEWE